MKLKNCVVGQRVETKAYDNTNGLCRFIQRNCEKVGTITRVRGDHDVVVDFDGFGEDFGHHSLIRKVKETIEVGSEVRLVAHPEHAFNAHSISDFEGWGYKLGMVGVVTAVDQSDPKLPLNVDWEGLDRPHYRPSSFWVDYKSVVLVK